MEGYYKQLELGKTYSITCRLSNRYSITTTGFRFIQVTSKGFNFLDVNKHRCIFKGHFYRSKKNSKFFISKKLIILEEK
jgi:hypothetical protein